MRILIDECVPRGIRRYFPGHYVMTVADLGWSGKKNGELVRLIAANNVDVFITVDQNLQFQQHLSGAGFGIVIISSSSNRLAAIVPLVPKILLALDSIQPGQLVGISHS
ncbi:MAG TPA: hypothetical protein VEQ85_08610 [Lacipirellulaceae bacterium]|nr:hypothetical protein [Lacipirellulaceae bacterium]